MNARRFLAVLVLMASSLLVQAQTTLTVKAILVDEQLNQKPVPKMELVFTREGGEEPGTSARTGFDGGATVGLRPGRYNVSTPSPVAFAGRLVTWTVLVEVGDQPAILELSNDNATFEVQAKRVVDDLAALYKSLENTVFTIWSDSGHGTGFLVDKQGLIVTNDHVVGKPTYLAVQFDASRKVRATLLASDPEKDIAILWADLTNIPEASAAQIAAAADSTALLIEGERVFTIGSPLSQRKIVTTGVASKVEKSAVISDININQGNSGGPLFNSLGQVVGIATFLEQNDVGPGISGIVRVEEALPLLAEARSRLEVGGVDRSSGDLLPTEPTDTYPLEALKAAIAREKFDSRPYFFSAGPYDVAVVTPVLTYWHRYAGDMAAARQKERRNRKQPQAVATTFQPLDEVRGWAMYAGEYKPVVQVFAKPKLRETFWSAVGRGLVAGAAAYGGTYANLPPATMRYAADFYGMKLTCGGREIAPIHPARNPEVVNVRNAYANATDATFIGVYTYPAEAISSTCGTVTLHIFSEKNPHQPIVKNLPPRTVSVVAADFAPYLNSKAR